MKDTSLLKEAVIYSVPVLLGYTAIGIGFGLLLSDAGYPWFLALFMSIWMYTGAGQYTAVGLFVSGAALLEACLIQLVISARHIAYGLSMLNRFPKGPIRPYLVFSMTDETFALLSSLPDNLQSKWSDNERKRFMFYVSLLDHCYWIGGSLAGAVIGSLLPFDMEGIGFSLTALFIILFLEQIFRAFNISKKPTENVQQGRCYRFSFNKSGVFLLSAAAALLSVILLPERITLLAGMVLALVLSSFWEVITGANSNVSGEKGKSS